MILFVLSLTNKNIIPLGHQPRLAHEADNVIIIITLLNIPPHMLIDIDRFIGLQSMSFPDPVNVIMYTLHQLHLGSRGGQLMAGK